MRITLVLAIAHLYTASPASAQCSGVDARAAISAAQARTRQDLLQFGYGHGVGRDSLALRFGQPDSVRVGTSASEIDAGQDSVTRVVYRSFAVHYIKPSGATSEIAYLVDLFAIHPLMRSPVPLGISREDAAIRVGVVADSAGAGDTVRVCVLVSPEDEAEEYAVLEFVRGVLTRIRWLFYWG